MPLMLICPKIDVELFKVDDEHSKSDQSDYEVKISLS